MGLEQNNEQHYREVVDKYHDPLVSYTMTTRDYVVRPDAATGDVGNITVTLPPVAEAKGRFYSIIAKDADNTNTITIEDNNNDSESWQTDLILNEKGRGFTFYSDGLKWAYEGDIHFTSSLDAGTFNLREVHLTMDTAGTANGEAFIARLTSPVMLGNSAGAIFAQTNFNDSAAGVAGLAYAIGAEMILPSSATIPSGHYTCIDYEIGTHPASDWDPAGGTKVSYMRFATWGTQTNVDDNAFWFTLAATELADHLVSLNAQTIRCQIEALTAGINKERFVVLSDTQNILSHSTIVAPTGRSLKIVATMAAPALTDGYGCNEFDVTLSGVTANHTAALSSWINMPTGTASATNIIAAQTNGIWMPDVVTRTNSKLIGGMRMTLLVGAPNGGITGSETVYWFSCNTQNNGITAVFDVSTATDLGTVANAGVAVDFLVPLFRDSGGNMRYVKLYTFA